MVIRSEKLKHVWSHAYHGFLLQKIEHHVQRTNRNACRGHALGLGATGQQSVIC